MTQFRRLLGEKPTRSVTDRVATDLMILLSQAELLLEQLDDEQTSRYSAIASLNNEIQHHEAEIDRGAALAHRLQQVQSVLETHGEDDAA